MRWEVVLIFSGITETKTPAKAGAMAGPDNPARRVLLFFVAQWNNQHVDVNGVDQLASRGHQFAPEVLVMTANDRVHVVFLIASTSTWPRSPLPLGVSVIG